jgi:phosphoglycerate dehydrogenase-like enzyme
LDNGFFKAGYSSVWDSKRDKFMQQSSPSRSWQNAVPRLGFVGLGNMGAALAMRLVGQPLSVILFLPVCQHRQSPKNCYSGQLACQRI